MLVAGYHLLSFYKTTKFEAIVTFVGRDIFDNSVPLAGEPLSSTLKLKPKSILHF